MIRVLHVFGKLDRGGAESRTMDIYRNLDRSHILFDFAVHTEESCAFDSEVRSMGSIIHAFPRFTGINYISYRLFWRNFLKIHQYTCIHVHVLNFAFAIFPELKKAGIPVRIIHARSASDGSWIKRKMIRLFRNTIIENSTHLLAVSQKAAAFAYGKHADSAVVVPNAIDGKKFSFSPEIRHEIRKDLGLENSLVIGHVGRFSPEKNHSFLLEVVELLLKKRSDITLLLIGDGATRADIETTAKLKRLPVIFAGTRDDVEKYLQAMDIFVFPSFFEGMPGTVIEAQAAGLPCLISDRITTECAIIPENCTFLPLSPEAWLNALQHLINSPRLDTYEQVKLKGFDVFLQINTYLRLYDN
jgi:glycosyltransferase involved in cell wall biosynthesis